MPASQRLSYLIANWRTVVIAVTIVKLLLMFWAPTYGDLFNWADGASYVLESLQNGHLPSVSVTGVYGSVELLLVPFFWVWTQLPFDHLEVRTVEAASHSSPAALSLIILMRVPPFLFDVAIGALLFRFVKYSTRSGQKGKEALLLWYVNPYNIFWVEVFGGMDAIPSFVLLSAMILASSRKWLASGLSFAIASILRLFPFLAFPFFMLGLRGEKARSYLLVLLGFLIPLIGLFVTMYAAGSTEFGLILNPLKDQPWLLDFLGFQLTNRYVRLVPALLALQFYVALCFWKERPFVHLLIVGLLAVLGAYAYSGVNNHFLWVVPFLTASVVLNRDESWIFVVSLIAASLHPYILPILPIPLFADVIHFLDPFFAGFFYAMTTAYLLVINLKNIKPSFSVFKPG